MFKKKSSTPFKQKQTTIKLSKIIDKNESDSPDIIETTPDESKKLKLRIRSINSKLKNSSKQVKNDKRNESHDFVTDISPIAKTVNTSRKLSLKKPLKRRCSFSPKKPAESKKQKADEKKELNDFPEDLEEITKYLTPDYNVEQVNKVKFGEIFKHNNTLTKKKDKEMKDEIFDLSNDSFLALVDEEKLMVKNPEENKQQSTSSEICMDESLDLMVLDSLKAETNAFQDSGIIMWIIKNISVKNYLNTESQEKKEHILQLILLEDKEQTAVCHLRDDWFFMEIEVGDIAHVSNLNATTKRCILDNQSKEYITIFPSTLIAGTTIAAGITCERQAVLNNRFKTDGQNEVMLVGTLIHELFEWALTNKQYSVASLQNQMNVLLQLPKNLETFYQLEVDEEAIAAKIKPYLQSIQQWSKSYLGPSPGSNVSIDKIVDIEENIWSPYLGFKGKVDVTVEVILHKKPALKNVKNTVLAPLELKTGKMLSTLGSVEHRAQVAVYCLLMRERHKMVIDSGLLYYIKTNHMQQVPMPEQEKRAIIIKRNEIARKLTLEKEKQTLPDLLRNKRICKRCPHNQVCMLHYKSRENGEACTSGVEDLYNELTSHLKIEDFEYFSKWYELLLLEAHHDTTGNKNRFIWKKSSRSRETRGVCFSGMLLVNEDVTSDMKYHYTFEREKNHFNKDYPMANIAMVVGDRVIISRERERVFNETTGYILDVSDNQVIISAHHKLSNTKNVSYRIDKDETLDSLSTPLSNLARLFRVESKNDEKVRQSIIHKKMPEFIEDQSSLKHNCQKLNQAQKDAVTRCLQAKDYVMILGMPGSGKSTTTAVLVESLVSSGKKVLLTSYTHSAVDTILLKLLQNGFKNFTRMGQPQRVHPSIREYTSQEQTKTFTKTQQLRQFYSNQMVFASTCLGANNVILVKQKFDYCIVDEASQLTQPVCIGAVRLADVFILVGDHNQLPPLVQSEKARVRGMDVSLFKSLSDSHPEGVVTLHYQYRMNKDIMSLANHLVYKQQMKCGNEAVANAKLSLCNLEKAALESDVKSIIDPNLPVIFVDTDNLKNCKEEIRTKKLVNMGEAELCKRIITGLLQAGLCSSQIGVICPYRHQLKILREEISTIKTGNHEVEIETIDKYQGKDKECIIVTFVRSNDQQEIGELLLDWRRVNVAVTRAKKKLILIGSRKTIVGSPILKEMLELLKRNKWIISL